MKEKKRWGKERKDDRDWKAYSERLVVRGEFLLDLDWVGSWPAEVARMNEGKRGARYEYPDSFMAFLAMLRPWIDYRGLEGVARKLVSFGKLPQASDFSTACRRINRMDPDIELPASCCASTDGSGMEFGNAGAYRARMYGKKRKKYLKVVVTADPETKKLLVCEAFIEGEGPSEPEAAQAHLEELLARGVRVRKFWGDGSYDALELFAFLERNGIEPAIKPRSNAVESGPPLRDQEVRDLKRLGYKEWAKSREYGKRWLGTEGIFSAVKRKFGEETRATRIENACSEAVRKFWAYDRMKAYAEARVRA